MHSQPETSKMKLDEIKNLEKVLTLGFKELGKLVMLKAFKVEFSYTKTCAPTLVSIFSSNGECLSYHEKLQCWLFEKEECLGLLHDFIASKNCESTNELSFSFLKKLVQLGLYESNQYTIVSDFFETETGFASYAIQIERSLNDRSYKLINIASPVLNILSENQSAFKYSDFYDANNVSFREFVILKMVHNFLSNLDIYKNYSRLAILQHLNPLLRGSARDYISSIQYYSLGCSSENEVDNGIYENFDTISSLNYESNEVNGTIFLTREIDSIQFSLKFVYPIKLNEYKKMRKMLEISSSKLFLVSDGAFAYGFIQHEDLENFSPISEVFVVNFLRRNLWKISSYSESKKLEILNIEYSFPKLQRSKIDLNEILITFHEVFKSGQEEMECIFDIIDAAVEQKRGTMLVFSTKASDESIRLKNASIPVNHRRLDQNLILQITEIDGAALFDQHGICYAIGVILDGMSGLSKKEDISRGARYNAAAKYLASNLHMSCVIVIISEDSNIDIMSNDGSAVSN